MKKAIGIAVLAALIVSLSGCANTDRPQTIQDSSGIKIAANEVDDRTEPEESSSASVSESKESSADSTATVKAEKESAQAETSQPTTEQSPAPVTQSPQTVVPNDTTRPKPPKAVEATPEPKPTPPPAEEKPTPEPAPTEPPQETMPPDEPAVPEFNIQTWIDYAKTYAVNVGLRLESTAVDCWDNPITAGAFSSCLERDIQSRLDRYSRDEDIHRCLDMGGETLRRELRFVYQLRLIKIKTEYFTMNALCKNMVRFFMCAEHGTNLTSESLATGIYRQV